MRQTAPQQALTPTTVRLAGSDTGGRGKPRRYRRKITLTVLAAIVFAGVAAGAGYYAHTESSGTPTASERAAAAATGLAQRWERVTAGTLFPQHVPYTTDLLNREAATRLGIGLASSCTAALDQTLRGLAAHYGCGTALRASYTDALGGTVYTVGVLVFPSPSAAGTFYARIPAAQSPGAGLHPLALAGTASARFTDAARQSSLARQTGPYVILVVAGYADGRPAAATGERRPPVFAPAAQLAGAVVTPLSAPSVVNCKDTTEWAC
jgi:hypothetical protein